jgi:hypothetical protein
VVVLCNTLVPMAYSRVIRQSYPLCFIVLLF